MLDGDVTDSVEARSISHRPDHVEIYSASWLVHYLQNPFDIINMFCIGVRMTMVLWSMDLVC